MKSHVAVVLCATSTIAASLAVAGEGIGTSAEAVESTQTAETTASAYSYTWDELVELIPDIKEMHLVTDRKSRRRVAETGELASTAKLCRREKSPTSLIRRRVCFTLDEYVEQYVEARKYYAEMMSGNMTRGMLGEGGGATATSRTSYP